MNLSLWIFFRKVLQKIQAIWTDNIKEKLRDEAIWDKFRIRCNIKLKSLKVLGDDWNKFNSCNSQIFIGIWVEEKMITEKEGKQHKKIDTIMGNVFYYQEVKMEMRQAIDKYQAWLELGLGGYELKRETWKYIEFKQIQKERPLHKMKELEFLQ
jgi:hypothetical protein